ncbi:MAG: hypothetical protein JGK40_12050 [Microcoleus sp. PH2017_21_RUC_O_A]|uniref:hypothetical protein n=1 Tax=Microcoleus sp. PH2017_21_RUC_O_A TaxID=2798832 RepID=UPI001D2B2DD3|nr:hypothetical protein [Microcoleus sp. PH2017_21_RUC_O_A]MCC3528794.1 hypothetical protein [Microcoleus sp. PH2017_21_RUC_O_A]
MSDSENKFLTMPYGLPKHNQGEWQYYMAQLHQTQGELQQSQSQLHQTQEELQQSQSQLHQTQEELQQSGSIGTIPRSNATS